MIKINNKEYYSADDLINKHPVLFKGCKTTRGIVNKKSIPEKMYTYATLKNNIWKITDGVSKKYDKLLLRKEWVIEQVDNLVDEEHIELAPDIIDLKKKEKFCDDSGDIIEIEVRGERHYNKCYFNVKDVAKGFDMKNIYVTIMADKGAYESGRDYKRFIVNDKKVLYLTYSGLLRVLFASHSHKADRFVKWASESLFTYHLGARDQKTIMASNLLGVTPDIVKAVFNKATTSLPCIYLIKLGSVAELRNVLRINKSFPDNECVYKYGFTEDLTRRMAEHSRNYAKIDIPNIELMLFSFVDIQYTSKAETEVRNYIDSMDLALPHEKFEELAVIPSKKYIAVKHQYETLGKLYAGHITDVINKMKEMQQQMDFNNEVHKRQLQEEIHKRELIEKDLENSKLRYQLLMMETGKKHSKII